MGPWRIKEDVPGLSLHEAPQNDGNFITKRTRRCQSDGFLSKDVALAGIQDGDTIGEVALRNQGPETLDRGS